MGHHTAWGNYNNLEIDSIPKELINKLSTGRKNMDNVKKIDPFQQMNADFDGVSNNKWIELYTNYSCPKDIVYSLQKYSIDNVNALQLSVTRPSVFKDILYIKNNVLYINKDLLLRVTPFYNVKYSNGHYSLTSVYISSNVIKYVDDINYDIIGNDKGDYLLYIKSTDNLPYILQHNGSEFTFVKLQDMLTINDDKKSNSNIDSYTDLSERALYVYINSRLIKLSDYIRDLIAK